MFKINKVYILIIFIIILLSSCGKKEEEIVIGNIVSDKTFSEKSNTISEEEKNRLITEEGNNVNTNKEKINKVKSFLRTFCKSYDDINYFVSSNHFKIIKERVDELENITNKFLYIELPTYVYESCVDKSPEYIETLILYLQTKNEDIPNLKNKVNNNNLENYIKNLSIINNENKPISIKNKNNFNKYFFNDNIEDLEAFYYPYYVKEKNNVSSFLSKPIFSLEKDNENKQLALSKLIKDLDELGFDSFEEFKTTTLKNNDFLTTDDLRKSIIADYQKIISNNKDLENILNNLGEYKTYINTGNYKELYNNNENNRLLKDLGKKMLINNIVSNDYADGLNEDWSGKEFFGDEKIGNGIIRLNFIYILSL